MDNPSAFPHVQPSNPQFACANPAMTLRDWFAGQALAGFTACNDGDGDVLMGPADTARAAYNYADAMLAARSQSIREGMDRA